MDLGPSWPSDRPGPGSGPLATSWRTGANLVIALVFWGCLRDPVRNVWVVDFGMIACAAVIPFALVSGRLRGIPWFWQGVDMSFG